MNWIKDHKGIVGGVTVAGVAIVAFLAFAVFGVHTLFIDDKVSEDGPVFASGAGATTAPTEPVEVTQPAVETDDSESAADAEESTGAPATTAAPTSTVASDVNEIITLASGSFIDRSHPGEGTVVVLNDGTEQRFLRFEADFETDNGPDLFVYLSRGIDADSPTGSFDDDFIDLGRLKGNIGSQNYEIPVDVDLSEYNTVSVWCRRFGVVFTAANLVLS